MNKSVTETISLTKRDKSVFIDFDLVKKKVDLEKNKKILDEDLTFLKYREFERTKHVHRLHPYLGKFIPQLVEVFLKKFFKKGDLLIDPFCGSGTTLIEANILGIHSIGIELSAFNGLITKVKTQKYNIELFEKEIRDILKKTIAYSKALQAKRTFLFEDYNNLKHNHDSEYLKTWFAERSLKEILYYRSLIPNYTYQDTLKVILSRSARSARLTTHYDLARPKKPIREKYFCIKHKQICYPIDECLKFIIRYSLDTIKRIKEFAILRTSAKIEILQGDSRKIEFKDKLKADGVFTSPPYVGLIDYHDQHRYAYELFSFENNGHNEIGSANLGQSQEAREKYKKEIASVFLNVNKYLKKGAQVFVVANDKFKLYSDIASTCNYRIKDVFNRPVLMRTERDTNQYFESIFFFEKGE